ncbi:MAG: bifunctional alpha/beta hydrolase/OsmC family protein [Gammaproteobacteria bacterium]|nr:bifunctional alpha/beta hydrolase/OsmC family protein [Gammaproteobacteria bacterium]
MRPLKVTFSNSSGETLTGLLALPANEKPLAFALFAHCFTCTKNIKAATNISQALSAQGIGVLRFDFTGLGESEGDFADTNFSSNVQDLIAAAEFLANEYEAPEILVGHSLGGTAILQAARHIASAKALATIGSPADPAHVAHLLDQDRDRIETEGEATVKLAGRPFKIKKQFLEDLESNEWRENLRGLRKALLVMHSPVDDIVEVDNAAMIFQQALHPKSFITLDDADHLLSREEDSLYAGAVLATWARKYITAAEEKAAQSEPGVVRTALGKTGLRVEVDANGHNLIADEPLSMGGTNTGPSPYDLLAAALGACTAMTLRIYANHKKLPLEEIDVHIRHEKIHGRDCEECETKDAKIDRFERELSVSGNLTDEQKQRLLEIADRCPVHRTLHSEVNIKTRLVD